METLFPHIRRHFDTLLDRLLCFNQQEVQVEGWFKGELLFLLSRLKDEGLISGFEREARIARTRSKIDVSVLQDDVVHWIELKHWHIGVQRGALLDPAFYFGDPTSVGIVRDVDKLVGLGPHSAKWLLILLTRNPGIERWEKGLERFHRKFTPRRLIAFSDPRQFPTAYFLGLLRVQEENTLDVTPKTTFY